MRIMKKEYFIVLGIIIVFISIPMIIFVPREIKRANKQNKLVEEKNKQDKKTNSNSKKNNNINTNTNKSNKGIKDDSFANNQVLVFFEKDVSYEEIENIMKEIDAYNENGEVNSINMYAFTFNNKTFKTRDELDAYCDGLMKKYPKMLSCGANNYVSAD